MYKKYLNPKNDLAFKKIFGEEKHKTLPISFINAVLELEGESKIIDLEFLNPKQPPEIAARKESIVDVLVKDQSGVKYIVEMQVAKVKGFEKRAQYYASKTYCAHFGEGQKYHDLKQVVFVAITDYVVFENKKNRYKSSHVILDKDSYEHDLKDFSFTFVELPKFMKELSELKTIEDRWCYFLKNSEECEDVEALIKDSPEIREAYDILDKHNWNEDQLQEYEKLNMNQSDMFGALEAAEDKGKAEGINEGIQQATRTAIFKMFERIPKLGIPLENLIQMLQEEYPSEDINTLYQEWSQKNSK